MIRTAILASALVLAVAPGLATAQTNPGAGQADPVSAQSNPVAAAPDGTAATPAASRMPAIMATFALNGAYRAIGRAEAQGGSGRYLDAAKAHYRNALARFGRADAGAAAEAMAAVALARAAVDERPLTVPRDIPAPPAIAAMPPRPAGPPPNRRAPMDGGRPGMRPPGPPGGRAWMGGRMGGGGFDAAGVARAAKLANTPEVTDLAQRALDADIARTRAAFAGNADEAMRNGRLASDLAIAVRSLAYADHPDASPYPMRRANGGSRTTTDDDMAPPPVPPIGMLPPPDDEDE